MVWWKIWKMCAHTHRGTRPQIPKVLKFTNVNSTAKVEFNVKHQKGRFFITSCIHKLHSDSPTHQVSALGCKSWCGWREGLSVLVHGVARRDSKGCGVGYCRALSAAFYTALSLHPPLCRSAHASLQNMHPFSTVHSPNHPHLHQGTPSVLPALFLAW